MFRLVCMAVSTFLLMDAGFPQAFRFQSEPASRVEFPSGQSLPLLPDLPPAADQQKPAQKPDRLQPESRLQLVRYVSGEFAKALKPLPSGKKGFRVKVGQPLDEQALHQAVANNGPAVSTGDKVQVTRLEFRAHDIVVDINGGGRGKRHWRDHIQVGVGGIPQVTTTTSNPSGAPGYQGLGATLYLDFGHPLPDMTPDELKQYLASVLDFSKQRSATVSWVETLPPEFQNAIRDKRPAVGMDRDMVIAAIGRPDHKVREHTPEGTETEDWIYGEPPAKTIFVRFIGDQVASIKQFP